MPRKSAEAIAASVQRLAPRPPRAPRHLDPAARRLWRVLAADLPPGLHRPATLELLTELVAAVVEARRMAAELTPLDVGSPEQLALSRALATGRHTVARLAGVLRLTPRRAIDGRSGALDEPGRPQAPLLGGTRRAPDPEPPPPESEPPETPTARAWAAELPPLLGPRRH